MPTLDWLNRAEALTLSDKVPYRVLDPVSEHHSPRPLAGAPKAGNPLSGKPDAELTQGQGERVASDDNLLIQGDNLDALKALLPFYRWRVKCIFIDPPYNTRSAFEHYDDNLEHSQWLSMMYPRLVLLRELLHESGSIWTTIDDNEGHYLKVLMDEVFGRRNFVANVVWQKRFSPNSTAIHLSDSHDHVLVYAKTKDDWLRNLLPRTEKSDSTYKNPDGDVRGIWTSSDLSARNFYSLGQYPIITPSGKEISGPPPGRYWTISKERFLELDADNRIWWGVNGSNQPRFKRFLSDVRDGVVPQTVWQHDEVGHTQEAKKEIVALFSADVFGTPKPERLMKRVLEIATNPGDLVLDSFLGSGTTAAVAHKMGRRWIGIEMGEHAQTHCLPRLQKVIEGEQGGISQAVNWQGGGGFRFLRLGEPMFNADGSIHPAVRFDTLAGFVWMQETGKPLALPDTLSRHSGEGRNPVKINTPRSGQNPGVDPLRGDLLDMLDSGLRRNDEGNKTPLLGVHEGRGIYLLFNGILGDKRPASGNVLTNEVLAAIDRICPHDGPKIIYGEACRLGAARLAAAGVMFKHIPYDVKAR